MLIIFAICVTALVAYNWWEQLLLPFYLLSLVAFVLLWPLILLAGAVVFFGLTWRPTLIRGPGTTGPAKKNPQA